MDVVRVSFHFFRLPSDDFDGEDEGDTKSSIDVRDERDESEGIEGRDGKDERPERPEESEEREGRDGREVTERAEGNGGDSIPAFDSDSASNGGGWSRIGMLAAADVVGTDASSR